MDNEDLISLWGDDMPEGDEGPIVPRSPFRVTHADWASPQGWSLSQKVLNDIKDWGLQSHFELMIESEEPICPDLDILEGLLDRSGVECKVEEIPLELRATISRLVWNLSKAVTKASNEIGHGGGYVVYPRKGKEEVESYGMKYARPTFYINYIQRNYSESSNSVSRVIRSQDKQNLLVSHLGIFTPWSAAGPFSFLLLDLENGLIKIWKEDAKEFVEKYVFDDYAISRLALELNEMDRPDAVGTYHQINFEKYITPKGTVLYRNGNY